MDISKIKEAFDQINNGISKLSGGPLPFYLEQLLAAWTLLFNRYAPFKVGDRVRISHSFKIAEGSDWNFRKHFLKPGAKGQVVAAGIYCGHGSESLRFDVIFDNESWIDRDGFTHDVANKHYFSMREHEIVKDEADARATPSPDRAAQLAGRADQG